MFESDKSENILGVTALTEMFPETQKVTALILEYDRDIFSAGISKTSFCVTDHFETGVYPMQAVPVNGGVIVSPRKITRAYANSVPEKAERGVNGRYVILELDPADEAAPSLFLVGEHRGCRSHMKNLRLIVRQLSPIPSAVGGEVKPQQGVYNTKTRNEVVDDFIQGEFEGLKYNLYIPKDYDPGRAYPLVQFIADSWAVGPDCPATLAQGCGGTIWAMPEEQAKRPCFVLSPQFPGPTIIEDDYVTRPELETAMRLLEDITNRYSIDKSRVYHTGQSMGAMSGFEWACRYPDTFSGMLLISGTGDPEKIARLKDKNIWLLASAADGRGCAILNRTADVLEKAGARVGRYVWDGGDGIGVLNDLARQAADDGCNVKFTLFVADSVVPDFMPADGAGNHRGAWLLAYRLEALREWLFSNTGRR